MKYDACKLRPDFLFSYWIVLWFLVYYFSVKTTPLGKIIQSYFNPTIALWVALFENLGTFILILIYRPTFELISIFIFMMVVLKLVPLYLLRNDTINWSNDPIVFLGVFLLYNIYLFANDETLLSVYRRTITSILSGKKDTPIFSLIHKMYILMNI
jgi:hypothetical protein